MHLIPFVEIIERERHPQNKTFVVFIQVVLDKAHMLKAKHSEKRI